MPKRTNDFQQLLHMIQKALAPVGAKVTESALVPGQGRMREIDVLIETDDSQHRIKIAVEGKGNETRPLDVEKIEMYIGKYCAKGSIPVNDVVVVARRGFTKTAKIRAHEAGVKLFTLDEATRSDWTKLVPQQVAFRMAPHIDRIELIPDVPKKGKRDPLTDGRFICNCHGTDKGSPKRWAVWFQATQVTPNQKLKQFMEEDAKRRNGQCAGPVSWPITNHTLLFEGRKYPVTELRIHLHCVNATGDVKWSSHNYKGCVPLSDGKTMDQMEALVGGKRIRTVCPSGPTSERVVLRVDSAPLGNDSTNAPDPPPSNFVFETLPAAYCPLHMPWAEDRPNQSTAPERAAKPKPVARKRMPVSNPDAKVGRNQPCPCGSGKKFKHCCLKNATDKR
jgi:hypothetical protein